MAVTTAVLSPRLRKNEREDDPRMHPMRLVKLQERRSIRPFQAGFAATLCVLLFFNGPSLAGLAWDDQSIGLSAASDARDATAVFPFKNTGESPITILSTKTSCGCTTATLSQTTFQPGESGQIDVVFAFGERIGQAVQDDRRHHRRSRIAHDHPSAKGRHPRSVGNQTPIRLLAGRGQARVEAPGHRESSTTSRSACSKSSLTTRPSRPRSNPSRKARSTRSW